MSYPLKVTTGTINYTDWLHVTAAKVISPSTVEYETWIDVPITNYNFIIPVNDPENYIVSFYDAATNVALGSLRLQLIVNALTNEFIYEKRYYQCDRGLTGDPVSGDLQIVDPYFTNKTIQSIFKEGFRFLVPATEWEMDTTTTTDDTIKLLTGVSFNTDEVMVVEIKLAAGVVAASGGSFYRGRVDVTAATYTVLVGDKNKRHRLMGTVATQVITLCSLSGFSQDESLVFDNCCGGVAKQVKILTAGVENIVFNGFRSASNNFTEFWVAKGEVLMIARVDNNWEVVLDYKGTNVGEHFAATYKDHPNTIIEDGQIGAVALDGDEYPRLWWWLKNVLPNTHFIEDDLVVNTSYVHPAGKEGLFVIHSTLKKFRTGNWQGLMEKGLLDFDTYNTDSSRVYDYPGGKQNQAIMNHRHFGAIDLTVSGGSKPNANTTLVAQNDSGPGDFKYILFGNGAEPAVSRSSTPKDDAGAANGNAKNIVDNVGVVYLRRF